MLSKVTPELADDTRRVARHHHAVWHILDDHSASPDENMLTNDHTR